MTTKAPEVGTRVALRFPEPHPLAGMLGEVVKRYHDRRGTWYAVVKIDRAAREYYKGCEIRAKADIVEVL